MLRLALLILTLLITACSAPTRLHVDSITATDIASQPKHYALKSGMPGIDENDLYFQEFSRYIHYILAQQGFEKSPENEAEILIYLSYGMNDGETIRYTYSVPVYDNIVGETYTLEETAVGGSGTTTTTSRFIVPPSYRITGREYHTGSYTTYAAFLILEAHDAKAGEKSPPIWRSSVQADSQENDLRSLLPQMVLTLQPYIAGNTGRVIPIKARPDNSQVQQLIKTITGVKE